jgi:hypothetical protein
LPCTDDAAPEWSLGIFFWRFSYIYTSPTGFGKDAEAYRVVFAYKYASPMGFRKDAKAYSFGFCVQIAGFARAASLPSSF